MSNPKILVAISPNLGGRYDDRNPVKEKHNEHQHTRCGENRDAGTGRSAGDGKRTAAKKAKPAKKPSRAKKARKPKADRANKKARGHRVDEEPGARRSLRS